MQLSLLFKVSKHSEGNPIFDNDCINLHLMKFTR